MAYSDYWMIVGYGVLREKECSRYYLVVIHSDAVSFQWVPSLTYVLQYYSLKMGDKTTLQEALMIRLLMSID